MERPLGHCASYTSYHTCEPKMMTLRECNLAVLLRSSYIGLSTLSHHTAFYRVFKKIKLNCRICGHSKTPLQIVVSRTVKKGDREARYPAFIGAQLQIGLVFCSYSDNHTSRELYILFLSCFHRIQAICLVQFIFIKVSICSP